MPLCGNRLDHQFFFANLIYRDVSSEKWEQNCRSTQNVFPHQHLKFWVFIGVFPWGQFFQTTLKKRYYQRNGTQTKHTDYKRCCSGVLSNNSNYADNWTSNRKPYPFEHPNPKILIINYMLRFRFNSCFICQCSLAIWAFVFCFNNHCTCWALFHLHYTAMFFLWISLAWCVVLELLIQVISNII